MRPPKLLLKCLIIALITHTVQPDLGNAVGMETTAVYIHDCFLQQVSIGLIFTFFRNVLAERIVQIDSIYKKDSTDEIMACTGYKSSRNCRKSVQIFDKMCHFTKRPQILIFICKPETFEIFHHKVQLFVCNYSKPQLPIRLFYKDIYF